MTHWTDQVKKLLEQSRDIRSVAELARRADVDYDRLAKALKRRTAAPRGDFVEKIARAFGVSEVHLRYGQNVEITGSNRFPLLDANKLGTITSLDEIKTIWDGEASVNMSADVSSASFCIAIPDDSCAPEFKKGDIIVCDPDQVLEPGSFVVAVVGGLSQAICRRYRQMDVRDPSRFTLVPINPDFPEILIDSDHPGLILGRAVAFQRKI